MKIGILDFTTPKARICRIDKNNPNQVFLLDDPFGNAISLSATEASSRLLPTEHDLQWFVDTICASCPAEAESGLPAQVPYALEKERSSPFADGGKTSKDVRVVNRIVKSSNKANQEQKTKTNQLAKALSKLPPSQLQLIITALKVSVANQHHRANKGV